MSESSLQQGDGQHIPDGYVQGRGLEGGDSFFEAFRQGLLHLQPTSHVSVKSLRGDCKLYARDVNKDLSHNSSYLWLRTVLGNDLKSYVGGIGITCDDEELLEMLHMTSPMSGTPEIDGRILCAVNDVELHMVEKYIVEGKNVIRHRLITKDSATSVNSVSSENCIHILDDGDQRFIPLLRSASIDTSGNVSVTSGDSGSITAATSSECLTSKKKENVVIFGFFNSNVLDNLIHDESEASGLEKSTTLTVEGNTVVFVNLTNPRFKTPVDIDISFVNTLKEKAGPFIVQTESKIWIHECGKEISTLDFEDLTTNSIISEDDFVLKLEEHFGMELLIQGVCSQVIVKSKKNRSIFDANIDVKEHYDSWKLISYAMQKDNLLAASYLSLFDWDLADRNEDDTRPLEVAAQYASVNTLSILLGVSPTADEVTVSEDVTSALKLADRSGKTPLLKAAENGKSENVQLLIRCGSDLNHEDKNTSRAVDLAWNGKHYDTVLVLLEADSRFPTKFDRDELTEAGDAAMKLKEFVDKICKLHELVQQEDKIEEIKQLVSNLTSKLLLNYDGKSLLSQCLERNNLNVEPYAWLKSNNFRFKDEEKEEEQIIENLPSEQKNLLKCAFLKYFPQSKDSHVSYLVSITTFSSLSENQQEKLTTIYKTLDKIEELSQILRVIENSDRLKIVFDPNSESIDQMDPTANDTTKGACEAKSGHVYIGAKTINDEFFGTLIHELSHFAITITYENEANPFRQNDERKRVEFNEIVDQLKDKTEVDEIISRVWKSYNQKDWPAELIVRVPHMIAKYGVKTGRDLLSEQAPQLLKFYDENLVSTYHSFINDIPFTAQRKNVQQSNLTSGILQSIFESLIRLENPIEEVNLFLQGQPKGVLILNTQNTSISLINVFQALEKKSLGFPNDQCLFWEFEKYVNNSSEINKIFCLAWSKVLVIEITSSAKETELMNFLHTLRELLKQFSGKHIILVVDESKKESIRSQISTANLNEVCVYVDDKKFTLQDLSLDHQSKLLEIEVNFQSCDNTIRFNQIVDADSYDIVDAATIIQLSHKNNKVNIGGFLPVSNDWNENNYIQRSFHAHCVIKQEIFKTDIHLAISGCSVEDLNGIGIEAVRFKSGYKHRVVCLDQNEEDGQFHSFCHQNSKHVCHWLNFEHDKFIYQRSNGTCSELEPFVEPEGKKLNYSEEEFLEESKIDKMVVVIGEPGSGKSTTCTQLISMIKKSDPTQIVVRIDLNDHTDQLYAEQKSGGNKINDGENICEFLLIMLNSVKQFQTKFEKYLFRKQFKQGRVTMFLDGFDEICPRYKDTVRNMIATLKDKVERLFVLTRPNVCEYLKTKFHVPCYNLRRFNEEEQADCLSQMIEQNLFESDKCSTKEETRTLTRQVLKSVSSSFMGKDMQLTSIPLILKLLAANLKDKCDEFTEEITLSSLIRGFVKKIYNEVYKAGKRDIVLSKDPNLDEDFEKYERLVGKLAVYQLFDEDDRKNVLNNKEIEKTKNWIEKKSEKDNVGIITNVVNNQPRFLHRVFQEYFVGNLIAKHLQCDRRRPEEIRFLLTEILKRDDYQGIRKFIDCELQGDGELKTVGTELYEIWSTDSSQLRNNGSKYNNDTILHIAVKECYTSIVKFILGCQKSEIVPELVNAKSDSETALYMAAFYSYTAIATLLAECGADVNIKGKEGRTALHTAAMFGHSDIATILLKHDADVNILNEKGESPLIGAVSCNSTEIVTMLLECGADVNSHDTAGTTAIHFAALIGHTDVAKILINNGADVNYLSNEGISPLQSALLRTSTVVIKPNIDMEDGETHRYRLTGLHSMVEVRIAGKKEREEIGYNHSVPNKDEVVLCNNTNNHRRAEVATMLLKHGADVNILNKDGQTPILEAAMLGLTNIVTMLANHGADVNVQCQDRRTALHFAAILGHTDILTILVKRDADVNIQDKEGQTALHFAVEFSYTDIATILIKHGAQINILNNDGISPLQTTTFDMSSIINKAMKELEDDKLLEHFNAARMNTIADFFHTNDITRLVKRGVDLSILYKNGVVPFNNTGYLRRADIATMLVTHGADVNIQDKEGRTTLHRAAVLGLTDIATMLVKHGADVNIQDKERRTSLHLAAMFCHIDIATMLVSHGADVDIQDKERRTSLQTAAVLGHTDIATILLEHGADVNIQDNEGQTSLHLVSGAGHPDIAIILLKHGADVNALDNEGLSSLQATTSDMSAIVNQVIEILEKDDTLLVQYQLSKIRTIAAFFRSNDITRLVKRGVDLSILYKDGVVPPNNSGYLRRADIATMLVKHGADVNIQGKEGRTTLHSATELGFTDIATMLVQHGADVNIQGKEGRTSLHSAAMYGLTDVATILAKHVADVNIQDGDGRTPLQLTAMTGHTDIAAMLIKHGANVNIQDKGGHAPLHSAAVFGHFDIATMLVKHGADVNALSNMGVSPLQAVSLDLSSKINDVMKDLEDDEKPLDQFKLAQLRTIAGFLHTNDITRLVKRRVDLSILYKDGVVPPNNAGYLRRADIATMLVQHGADVNIQDDEGRTTLHKAAMYGYSDIATMLVKQGADVNIQGKRGQTSLHLAAMLGHTDISFMLVNHGAYVDIQDEDGRTPLQLASLLGHTDIATMLVKHGADVNTVDNEGAFPLQVVSFDLSSKINDVMKDLEDDGIPLDQFKLAKLRTIVGFLHTNDITRLVKRGVDLSILYKDGVVPPINTGYLRRADIATMLVTHGADINIQDKEGRTALHAAVVFGHIDIATMLVKHGANANFQENEGQTALHASVVFGHTNIATMLVKHGANVNIQDTEGKTTLHLAVALGHTDIATLLVKFEAKLDLKDNSGDSPFQSAVLKGACSLVEIMIQHGANIFETNDHDTLLHRTLPGGDINVMRLVLNKLVDQCGSDQDLFYRTINAADNEGDTPLMWASEKNRVEEGKVLIEYGADVNFKNFNGRTAVHWACEKKCVEFLLLLIENKADLAVFDKRGETPFELAMRMSGEDSTSEEQYHLIASLIMSAIS